MRVGSYIIARRYTYPHLACVLARPIDWDLIEQQYDEMVRYTTAMAERTADPETILRRFTRANAQHPTYKALAELGKALKTIFLCRYLDDEALRREIHEGLNVVETWNSANGFIFFGKGGEVASNRLVKIRRRRSTRCTCCSPAWFTSTR